MIFSHVLYQLSYLGAKPVCIAQGGKLQGRRGGRAGAGGPVPRLEGRGRGAAQWAAMVPASSDDLDDPAGLIAGAFAMGGAFPGPAEDVFLGWLLRLGEGVEVAAAAGRLLARYGGAEGHEGDAA